MAQKSLRIAVVVGTFPTVSETFIVNQLNSLTEQGHDVSLFSYEKGKMKDLHSSITQNKWQDTVHYANRLPKSYVNRLRFVLWFLRHRWKKIRFGELLRTFNIFSCGLQVFNLQCFFEHSWFLDKPDFDIIHVHFGPNAEKIGKLKSRGFLGKTRLVATFHGYDLVTDRVNDYPAEYQHIWKHFDCLTVNTPYLEGILKQLPVIIPPVSILPMGLDTEFFKPTKLEKSVSPFQLLFVGRLIPLKGVDLAIRAVATLKGKGYKVALSVIGEGPQEEALRSLTRDLGIVESVHFLGAKPQEEVKEIMNQSYVLLMPGRPDPDTGREETQGLVIQEAQAMGLPVVVSNAGGMQHGIMNHETGFLFPAKKLEDLVSCLLRLIDDRILYEQMSFKAREFVVKNYDYRILGRELHQTYLQLLK